MARKTSIDDHNPSTNISKTTGYLLVMVLGAVVSGVAALWVRSSYSRWSKRISTSGLNGAEVARAILDRNGLWNVRVEPVAGTLTDHYDPSRKAVRLSEGNFRGSSIASVSNSCS